MAKLFLIEATPWNPATAATVNVRLAGGGSKPYNHLTFSDWMAGIVDPPAFTSAVDYQEQGWTGGAIPQTSQFRWAPSHEPNRTAIGGYVWKGASISIKSADDEANPVVYTTEVVGTVAGISVQEGVFAFTIQDLSGDLAKPVLVDRFLGTGGIEGDADCKDRIKRRTWGRAFNVEGFVLKKASNIFEFSHPSYPLSSFDDVKDMGRSASPAPTVVAYAGSIAATLTALDAVTPAQGSCAVAPSIGCVKWWTSPSGPLTADIKGEVGAGYLETGPEIASRVVAARSSLVTMANLAAATALRPDPAGLHVYDDSETIGNALDRLLMSMSLGWTMDPAGALRMLPFTFSSPVETIKSQSVTREAIYKPTTKRLLGYGRNHRLHTNGEISASILAGDISWIQSGATPIAIGTAPPVILGNSVNNNSATSTYEAMTRGPALAAACFAECDIAAGAVVTSIGLDTSATDKAGNNQELLVEYTSSSGLLNITRVATSILSTTIATGITGKLQAAYDGVRYRVFVGGTEQVVSLGTYPGMAASAGPLVQYPKWTPYTAGSTLTGLNCGPYTNNDFSNMSGPTIPEANATTGGNVLFNGDAEQGDLRGWETETLAGSAQGTFAVDTAFAQSGQYSFKMTKPLTTNKQGNNSYAIPCNPGQTFVIRLWAYVGAGTASGFKLKIYERTLLPVTGRSCSAQNATAIQTPINNVATSAGVNTWVVEYTVGAGMYYFSVGLLNDNGGPVLCYYECQVVKVINPLYDVATLGSIPPTIPNVSFTYTSTTTTITVSWAAMTIYRANGTTISISAGSQAITGLTANTNYQIYPYAVDTGGTTATMAFVTGVTGSSGSPAVCYPTAGSAEAAAVMYQRGNIPLYTLSASTPASGSGGGGGGGRACINPRTPIETRSGWIDAGELRQTDELCTPQGFAPLLRLERHMTSDWIEVTTQDGYVIVTPDHRLHLLTGAEVRAHDLRIGHWLQARDCPQRVIGLRLIEEAVELVQVELDDPHLYFLGRASLLCHNPKF